MRSNKINHKILAVVLTLAIVMALFVPMGTVLAAGPWAVTACTNSGGGTISPAGTTNVPDGGYITFTITPDGGGAVSHVWDNGVDKGAITTYNLTSVTAKHTVVAAFTPYPQYTLQLVGAMTTNLTQAQVEAMVAAHPASWVNGTDTWSGVALWRLIALVDDSDPSTFNSALASVYSVQFTGADGYVKAIPTSDYGNFTFANNDSVIVANQLNGTQLSFVTSDGKVLYPLKSTGSGCGFSSQRVGGLVKIALLNLPVTTVSVSPSSQAVANGAPFTVNLTINTNQQVRGWQTNVTFDASKLIANSVTEGTFLSDYATAHGGGTVSGGAAIINNTAGNIAIPGYAITGAGTGGPTGTGTLCTLAFTAKTGVNAFASITPYGVVVSDQNATAIPGVVVTGGMVAIGNVPMPDLVVSALSAAKVSDTTYNITYTITNQGNAAAGACSTSIVIDGGAPIVVACPALAALASDTQTMANQTFTSPTDTILVTADSANAVAESTEGNNNRQITYAPVSGSGTTIINGNIAAKLELAVPAPIDPWNLVVGSNDIQGTLNVKCNTNWQVQVNDQNSITNGHMTKWLLSSGYDPSVKLIAPLTVGCLTSVDLSGTPQTIVTGTTSGQSGNSGQDCTISFHQPVLYADPVLGGGYSYHIVVTFTASSTF